MNPKSGLVLGAGGARGFAHLGFFKPYRDQGHLLVDGAVKNRLPVHIARDMGADKVVAVDVKRGLMNKLSSAMDILVVFNLNERKKELDLVEILR